MRTQRGPLRVEESPKEESCCSVQLPSTQLGPVPEAARGNEMERNFCSIRAATVRGAALWQGVPQANGRRLPSGIL